MPEENDEVLGDRPSRSDLRLVERALRQDWPIPPKVKTAILQGLVNIATAPDDPTDEAAPGHRTRILAARCLAALGELTIRQQALDLARARSGLDDEGAPKLAELVAKAEALADERERERGREDG